MTPQEVITVWIGDWGTYLVPPHLRDVPIRRDGFPDMRGRRASELLKWADQMDANERDAYEKQRVANDT